MKNRVLRSRFTHFLAETVPPLYEILDRNPAEFLFPAYLHAYGPLRRVIRRIAGAQADNLANAPIPTADEWIGQCLGFFEGHHAFSAAVRSRRTATVWVGWTITDALYSSHMQEKGHYASGGRRVCHVVLCS
jgi:hypothetical protein